MTTDRLTIVEVGPRDGFQSIGPYIPTKKKIDLIDRLYQAGIRRMEATAFVSKSAVPQLADAEDVLAHTATLPGLDAQVLVPSLKQAERAIAAGADHLVFVLSVSERHNRGNVKRSPLESVDDFRAIVALLEPDIRLRVNIATAFDCPHDGSVAPEATLALIELLAAVSVNAEFCLCDTTGRVTPDRVTTLLESAQSQFPTIDRWAFHGHDTYGQGITNALAAWKAGIRVIDASFSGLGGCPFAPGATGNVATEDLVWTFNNMGIDCAVDLDQFVDAATLGAALPGANFGGRVRDAWIARRKMTNGT